TGKVPAPRKTHIVEPAPSGALPRVSEKEQQLYAVKEPQGSGNPYQWDFDLCSQTLGNFNYRKMSLVQDYAALLEQDVPGRAFDAIFSLEPRLAAAAPAALPLCDPVSRVNRGCPPRRRRRCRCAISFRSWSATPRKCSRSLVRERGRATSSRARR